MDFEHTLAIGDWSGDGHERYRIIPFKASHSREDIVAAYLQAIEQIGIALHNDPYGLDAYRSILCTYEEYAIISDDFDLLVGAGVNMAAILGDEVVYEEDRDAYTFTPVGVVQLFLEFVRVRIPDFQYELITPPKPINGFWQDYFNVQIGYGVL